jgi:RHS repeat-associated protein
MYTSQYGRFMQSDPVTQGCGNRNPDILAGANQRFPQSLNRYGFVRNDPVNLTDPSGLYGITPDEADILCSMGVLEFCGWRGGGGNPGCYYSKAGCGSGGGGGSGFIDDPLREACDKCIAQQKKICEEPLFDCFKLALGIAFAAASFCLFGCGGHAGCMVVCAIFFGTVIALPTGQLDLIYTCDKDYRGCLEKRARRCSLVCRGTPKIPY